MSTTLHGIYIDRYYLKNYLLNSNITITSETQQRLNLALLMAVDNDLHTATWALINNGADYAAYDYLAIHKAIRMGNYQLVSHHLHHIPYDAVMRLAKTAIECGNCTDLLPVETAMSLCDDEGERHDLMRQAILYDRLWIFRCCVGYVNDPSGLMRYAVETDSPEYAMHLSAYVDNTEFYATCARKLGNYKTMLALTNTNEVGTHSIWSWLFGA